MNSSAPLDKLYISERNARKTGRDVDVELMARSIARKGLLQNLVVVDEKKGKGRFGVVAGGRRLLALQLLDQRGELPASVDRDAIPILIEPLKEGRESSLEENRQKVAMNAVDEFEAYASIIADYADEGVADPAERIARCAHHFGETVRYIEQRLRLAALAPEILEALRSGAITLDAAKAYAVVADHGLQLQVFAAQERQGQHRVDGIRSAIAGRTYRAGDQQVRYVGLAAYVAAGGRVDRDLFMGSEDDQVVLDTELLDRLAGEKGELEARQVASSAGYAGAVLKGWGAYAWQWPKTPEGLERVYSLAGLKAEERAHAVVICRIAKDGTIELTDEGFKPAPETPRADSSTPAPKRPESLLSSLATAKSGESEIERLARIRRQKIEATALRLAVPIFEATPLEGRIFHPPEGQEKIPPVQEDDQSYFVAVYVKVPKADVGRRMAEAEALVDGRELTPGAGPPWPPAAADGEAWPDDTPAREPAEAEA